MKTALFCLAACAAMGSLSAQTSWLASTERLEAVSDDDPTRLPVGLGARIQLVWATYDATIEKERAGKSGNQIELDDELPLDDDGVGWDFRGWVRIGEWVTLDGRYLRLGNGVSGGRAKNGFSFDYLGVAFGDRVEVEHTLEMAWGGARISTGLDDPRIRVSVPVGLLYTSQRLVIENLEPGPGSRRASDRLVCWTPYLGVHAQGVLWDGFGEAGFEVEALVGWAYLDVSGYLTYGYKDFLRFYAGPRILLFAQERENDDDLDRVSEFQVYSLVVGVSVGF